jgi:hypothetical protein
MYVYGSNLVIKAGGTVTLPAESVASAALTDKTAILSTITMTIATNANGGTNVVTYTGKDIAGTTVTTPFAFRTWITDDKDGALAAVDGDVAVSTGMELQQVVDKADYWVVATNLTGTAVVTITDTPGGTNYIHCLSPMGFRTTVVSAFNAP